MPSTDHYPAKLVYREPFLKTFQSQTAMSSRHPRQAQRAPRPEAAKTAEGAKGYKRIYITELPIIDLSSGPNISHIREAIIQYCHRELGSIAGIFIEGIYSPPATASYNVEEIKADNTGLKKEEASARIKLAESDNDKYEKDKIKPHGILSGMTTREVDERVQALTSLFVIGKS